MASQTYLSQTVGNDTSIGTLAWTSIDNIKVDDENIAYIEPESSYLVTNYIKCTNFGFTIFTLSSSFSTNFKFSLSPNHS